jgi:outer membrane protein assembly factor BamB
MHQPRSSPCVPDSSQCTPQSPQLPLDPNRHPSVHDHRLEAEAETQSSQSHHSHPYETISLPLVDPTMPPAQSTAGEYDQASSNKSGKPTDIGTSRALATRAICRETLRQATPSFGTRSQAPSEPNRSHGNTPVASVSNAACTSQSFLHRSESRQDFRHPRSWLAESLYDFRYLLIALLLSLPTSLHADWPQFRGVNSDGIGTGSPPIEFGPGKNELWKAPLLPGHSSPCVAGNRIFLTAYEKKLPAVVVVCLDRTTGKLLWEESIKVDALEKGHPSFNPASSSPCCDDERVVAYFGSYGLVCCDLDGRRLWEKQLPLAKSFGGNATSPMIVGDNVILYRGNYVDHYLLCLDKNTGQERWRVTQDEEFTGEMACTACPIVADNKLICHTARSVQAFDINSGESVWIAKCATTATSTPILVGDEVIVAAWNKLGEPDLGPPFPSFNELIAKQDQNDDQLIQRNEFPKLWIFHRPAGAEAAMNGAPVSWRHANNNGDDKIDRDEWNKTTDELEKFRAGYDTHGLLAIPINSEGFVAADQVRTLVTDGIPEVPSPVSDGTYVYMVKNGGLLTCIDITSGDLIYRMRTRGTGTHYASPLIAGDKLYTFAGNGKVSVIELGESQCILAVNEMRESVFATPAIVDGVIYVRTHAALHAFTEASN